jgi:hypothetical protein
VAFASLTPPCLSAGLLRGTRATLMGHGSTDVRFVTRVVNRENLNAVAGLLESGRPDLPAQRRGGQGHPPAETPIDRSPSPP